MFLCQPRTFGPHGCGALLRHRWEDARVVADIGVGLPADVAIMGVEGGRAGDEVGANWKERAELVPRGSTDLRHPSPRAAVLCCAPPSEAAGPCMSGWFCFCTNGFLDDELDDKHA